MHFSLKYEQLLITRTELFMMLPSELLSLIKKTPHNRAVTRSWGIAECKDVDTICRKKQNGQE